MGKRKFKQLIKKEQTDASRVQLFNEKIPQICLTQSEKIAAFRYLVEVYVEQNKLFTFIKVLLKAKKYFDIIANIYATTPFIDDINFIHSNITEWIKSNFLVKEGNKVLVSFAAHKKFLLAIFQRIYQAALPNSRLNQSVLDCFKDDNFTFNWFGCKLYSHCIEKLKNSTQMQHIADLDFSPLATESIRKKFADTDAFFEDVDTVFDLLRSLKRDYNELLEQYNDCLAEGSSANVDMFMTKVSRFLLLKQMFANNSDNPLNTLAKFRNVLENLKIQYGILVDIVNSIAGTQNVDIVSKNELEIYSETDLNEKIDTLRKVLVKLLNIQTGSYVSQEKLAKSQFVVSVVQSGNPLFISLLEKKIFKKRKKNAQKRVSVAIYGDIVTNAVKTLITICVYLGLLPPQHRFVQDSQETPISDADILWDNDHDIQGITEQIEQFAGLFARAFYVTLPETSGVEIRLQSLLQHLQHWKNLLPCINSFKELLKFYKKFHYSEFALLEPTIDADSVKLNNLNQIISNMQKNFSGSLLYLQFFQLVMEKSPGTTMPAGLELVNFLITSFASKGELDDCLTLLRGTKRDVEAKILLQVEHSFKLVEPIRRAINCDDGRNVALFLLASMHVLGSTQAEILDSLNTFRDTSEKVHHIKYMLRRKDPSRPNYCKEIFQGTVNIDPLQIRYTIKGQVIICGEHELLDLSKNLKVFLRNDTYEDRAENEALCKIIERIFDLRDIFKQLRTLGEPPPDNHFTVADLDSDEILLQTKRKYDELLVSLKHLISFAKPLSRLTMIELSTLLRKCSMIKSWQSATEQLQSILPFFTQLFPPPYYPKVTDTMLSTHFNCIFQGETKNSTHAILSSLVNALEPKGSDDTNVTNPTLNSVYVIEYRREHKGNLLFYMAQFNNNHLPTAGQILICEPGAITELELELFLKRALYFVVEPLFILDVEKLDAIFVESIFNWIKKEELHAPIYILTKQTTLDPRYQNFRRRELIAYSNSVESIKQTVLRKISSRTNIQKLFLVFGSHLVGKTTYIRNQMASSAYVRIILGEAFDTDIVIAIDKLKQLTPQQEYAAVLLHLDISGYANVKLLNQFLMDLLIFGTIKDRTSGEIFSLPNNQWIVYAEMGTVPYDFNDSTCIGSWYSNILELDGNLQLEPPASFSFLPSQFRCSILSIGEVAHWKLSYPECEDTKTKYVANFLLHTYKSEITSGKGSTNANNLKKFAKFEELKKEIVYNQIVELENSFLTNCPGKQKVLRTMLVPYLAQKCFWIHYFVYFLVNNCPISERVVQLFFGPIEKKKYFMVFDRVRQYLSYSITEGGFKQWEYFYCYENDRGKIRPVVVRLKSKLPREGELEDNIGPWVDNLIENLARIATLGNSVDKIFSQPDQIAVYLRNNGGWHKNENELTAGKVKEILAHLDFIITAEVVQKISIIFQNFSLNKSTIFKGDTGVGKTELTRLLIHLINEKYTSLNRGSLMLNLLLSFIKKQRLGIAINKQFPTVMGEINFYLDEFVKKYHSSGLFWLLAKDIVTLISANISCNNNTHYPPLIHRAIERGWYQNADYRDTGTIQAEKEKQSLVVTSDAELKQIVHDFLKMTDFLKIILVNQQTTADYIRKRVREVRNKAAGLQGSHYQFVIFFDEINTSKLASGTLKEILVNRTLSGERLPPNLNFIAAANPEKQNSQTTHFYNFHESSANDKAAIKEQPKEFIVQPLHPSLDALCVDLGSFVESDSKESFRNSQVNHMICVLFHQEKESLGGVYSESFKDLLIISLRLLFEAKICRNHPSIRHIMRARQLYKYFRTTESGNAIIKLNNQTLLEEGAHFLSMILAIGLTFYLSLESKPSETPEKHTREHFNRTMCQLLTHWRCPCKFSDFAATLESTMKTLFDRADKPGYVAATSAATENFFAMLIAIENKLPLIIVGPAGVSKTLMLQIVLNNVAIERRKYSPNPFNFFTPVQVIRFQCTRESSDNEIKQVYERAEHYQKYNGNIMVMVLIEEAGLANEERMPLKEVHYHLDHPIVASVLLSNVVLDAAKMNRCIYVLQYYPKERDLEKLARAYLFPEEEQIEASKEEFVNGLCRAYILVTRANSLQETIKGDVKAIIEKLEPVKFEQRDFTAFLSYIARAVKLGGFFGIDKKVIDCVMRGLGRNFNGVPFHQFQLIGGLFLNEIKGCFKGNEIEYQPIDSIISTYFSQDYTLRYLKESISEQIREGEDPNVIPVRHIMLIDPTNSGIAISLLQNKELKLTKKYKKNIHFLQPGNFQEDANSTSILMVELELKNLMETPSLCILQNSLPIASSFYDVYNRNFKKVVLGDETKYYASVGIGTASENCFVDVNFKTIIILNQSELERCPLPFFSRCEKFYLTPDHLLSTQQLPEASNLKSELRNFIDNKHLENISIEFCGIHINADRSLEANPSVDICINSLVYESSLNKEIYTLLAPIILKPEVVTTVQAFKETATEERMNLFRKAIARRNEEIKLSSSSGRLVTKLLQLATPESVNKIHQLLQPEHLIDYYMQQEHFSAKRFIGCRLRTTADYSKYFIFLRSDDTIFSVLPARHSFSGYSVTVENFQAIKSQKACASLIENYFSQPTEKSALILVINAAQTEQSNINYLKWTIDKYSSSEMGDNRLIFILCYFPPGIKRCNYYNVNWLNGWDFYYIDSVGAMYESNNPHTEKLNEAINNLSRQEVKRWMDPSHTIDSRAWHAAAIRVPVSLEKSKLPLIFKKTLIKTIWNVLHLDAFKKLTCNETSGWGKVYSTNTNEAFSALIAIFFDVMHVSISKLITQFKHTASKKLESIVQSISEEVRNYENSKKNVEGFLYLISKSLEDLVESRVQNILFILLSFNAAPLVVPVLEQQEKEEHKMRVLLIESVLSWKNPILIFQPTNSIREIKTMLNNMKDKSILKNYNVNRLILHSTKQYLSPPQLPFFDLIFHETLLLLKLRGSPLLPELNHLNKLYSKLISTLKFISLSEELKILFMIDIINYKLQLNKENGAFFEFVCSILLYAASKVIEAANKDGGILGILVPAVIQLFASKHENCVVSTLKLYFDQLPAIPESFEMAKDLMDKSGTEEDLFILLKCFAIDVYWHLASNHNSLWIIPFRQFWGSITNRQQLCETLSLGRKKKFEACCLLLLLSRADYAKWDEIEVNMSNFNPVGLVSELLAGGMRQKKTLVREVVCSLMGWNFPEILTNIEDRDKFNGWKDNTILDELLENLNSREPRDLFWKKISAKFVLPHFLRMLHEGGERKFFKEYIAEKICETARYPYRVPVRLLDIPQDIETLLRKAGWKGIPVLNTEDFSDLEIVFFWLIYYNTLTKERSLAFYRSQIKNLSQIVNKHEEEGKGDPQINTPDKIIASIELECFQYLFITQMAHQFEDPDASDYLKLLSQLFTLPGCEYNRLIFLRSFSPPEQMSSLEFLQQEGLGFSGLLFQQKSIFNKRLVWNHTTFCKIKNELSAEGMFPILEYQNTSNQCTKRFEFLKVLFDQLDKFHHAPFIFDLIHSYETMFLILNGNLPSKYGNQVIPEAVAFIQTAQPDLFPHLQEAWEALKRAFFHVRMASLANKQLETAMELGIMIDNTTTVQLFVSPQTFLDIVSEFCEFYQKFIHCHLFPSNRKFREENRAFGSEDLATAFTFTSTFTCHSKNILVGVGANPELIHTKIQATIENRQPSPNLKLTSPTIERDDEENLKFVLSDLLLSGKPTTLSFQFPLGAFSFLHENQSHPPLFVGDIPALHKDTTKTKIKSLLSVLNSILDNGPFGKRMKASTCTKLIRCRNFSNSSFLFTLSKRILAACNLLKTIWDDPEVWEDHFDFSFCETVQSKSLDSIILKLYRIKIKELVPDEADSLLPAELKQQQSSILCRNLKHFIEIVIYCLGRLTRDKTITKPPEALVEYYMELAEEVHQLANSRIRGTDQASRWLSTLKRVKCELQSANIEEGQGNSPLLKLLAARVRDCDQNILQQILPHGHHVDFVAQFNHKEELICWIKFLLRKLKLQSPDLMGLRNSENNKPLTTTLLRTSFSETSFSPDSHIRSDSSRTSHSPTRSDSSTGSIKLFVKRPSIQSAEPTRKVAIRFQGGLDALKNAIKDKFKRTPLPENFVLLEEVYQTEVENSDDLEALPEESTLLIDE